MFRRRRYLPAAPLLTLGAALSGPAWAAPTASPVLNKLEKITVTATRTAADLADVPATVTVIPAERIEDQFIESIEDLVRYEVGVSVRNAPARFSAALSSTGRDGNAGFNIRGLEGNRVLIQVDGVRVPDAYSFGAQSVGRGDYVDLGILKSVEILRGPASAMYGSDGVAGAVSFLTKDPTDLLRDNHGAYFGLRGAYGNADQSSVGSAVVADRSGHWSAMLAYTRHDGEGTRTQGSNHSANTDRTAANPEDNYSNALLAKLVHEFSDGNRLRLSWDHLDRGADWTVLSAIAKPPLSGTSTLSLTAFDRMQRDRVTLDHLYDSDRGVLRRLRSSVYYQDSHTRQFSSEDRNTAADRIRDNTFDNAVRGAAIEATSRMDTGPVAHQVVYGADYSRTAQESLRNGTVPPVGEKFPLHAFPTTDYTLAGVFVQDSMEFGTATLLPALRWDSFRISPRNDALFVAAIPAGQKDSRVSPKLGVVIRLGEQYSLFANAAAGFKAPAPSQVNNGFTNTTQYYRSISNSDLKPETSKTLEGGLRVNNARWSASIAAYTGRYKDFIEQVQVGGSFTPTDYGVYQYVNLRAARIHGVELRSQLQLAPGLMWTVSAAKSSGDSELQGVKAPLVSIDPLKVVSGLDWKAAADRATAQFMVIWSDRKQADRLGVNCSGGCYVPGGYVVMDLLGSLRINDALLMRVGIFNLADRKYANWADVRGIANSSLVKDAYTQPGRNANLSLTLRY